MPVPNRYKPIGTTAEVDFKTTRPCLVLEVKGFEDNQTKAKHDAAKRWVMAVNNWGQLGRWMFHVCRNPLLLDKELAYLDRKV